MKKQLFLYTLMLSNVFLCNATSILKGDPAALENETFSFPIKSHAFGNRFYVGAANQMGGLFSIARVSKSGDSFEGLTHEYTKLNGIQNQLNPLFNAKILLLKLLDSTRNWPVVVTQTGTDVFLLQEQSTNNFSTLRSSNIKDAAGSTTNGIVAIETTDKSQIVAAVKGNGEADFGTGASGIALLGLIPTDQDVVGTNFLLNQFNSQPNSPIIQATSLTTSTDSIFIHNPIANIGNIVDIHWSSALDIFYIGLQTEASAGVSDGTRSIVTAHIKNNNIFFNPIAPDNVFSGSANKIVGAIGANELVSIHKVRTLQTPKSLLTYLVVVGNNGPSSITNNVVFSLPVVNTRVPGEPSATDFTIQGTLASINQTPKDLFNSNNLNKFQGREFVEAATQSTEIFTNTDAPAQVGGGPLAAGSIDDIFVINGTVFAAVGSPSIGQAPGIFYSEALYNEDEVIIGWTNWERISGTTDQVFGVAPFVEGLQTPWDGSFIFITGTSSSTSQTVKKTTWSSGDPNQTEPLSALLNKSFPVEDGGIRNLRPYSVNLASLNDISLMVATGLARLVLIESGQIDDSGVFLPTRGAEFIQNKKNFGAGTIEETFVFNNKTRYIEISGGVLDDLGPIVTSEIAHDSTISNGWLFAGGMNALAVLSKPDGKGWDITSGYLTTGFTGLTNNMSFKKIGNYTNIRKLISDRGFLYVLTDTQLDRINLQTSNFATNTIDNTIIADLSTVSKQGVITSFIDIIVSEKIAILATSIGLFRLGNDKNIASITSSRDAHWTYLPLPQSILPISQLLPITSTSLPQDVSRNGGGIVYALNAYRGFDQGRLHRIAIEDTTATTISNNTILPFNDLAFKGVNSYFATFNAYRDLIGTNSALLLSSIDRNLSNPPQLFSGTHLKTRIIQTNISYASDLISILRSYSTGSWLIAGDFGIRINE